MGSTIRDVARMAEVSIATVSRVLNKTSPVSEDKRTRVEQAVEKLAYTPNPAAVSLLKGETGGIGVLLPAIGGEFFAELLYGIDNAVQEHGYILMVSPSHRSQHEIEAGIRAISQRVDGLLVMATDVDVETIEQFLPPKMPVLYLNTRSRGNKLNYINFDNFEGMKMMTEHLLDFGHKNIAFISGPAQARDAGDRLAGYLDAIAKRNDDAVKPHVFDGDFSLESGHVAANEILQGAERPTAILAANDLSAQGALRAMLEAGIDVPTQMALAGFDNIPSSQFMTPPLSTVNVPVREMGIQALDHLVAIIKSTEPPESIQVTIPAKLVIRESSIGCETVAP